MKFAAGALKVGDLSIPLDDQGQFLLKYRGPSRSHKRFSAANVIASEARRHTVCRPSTRRRTLPASGSWWASPPRACWT